MIRGKATITRGVNLFIGEVLGTINQTVVSNESTLKRDPISVYDGERFNVADALNY